jgi:hypothetical protein
MISQFYEIEPTLENFWRSIILFGRNVASYKFALAKALYELKESDKSVVTLEELAEPFSRHICAHLEHSPKQVTSKSSRFLNACAKYNEGTLTKDDLVSTTVSIGFNNVIDAFHIVNGSEVPKRFFMDERKGKGGIRLTDDFYQLTKSIQFGAFANETEARWRLVEESWKLGLSRNLIKIDYDSELQQLFIGQAQRRVNITSCRDSLNGYQKGRCFYCFRPIAMNREKSSLADIDHFLPWIMNDEIPNVNGIWNLVLSCQDCNRGEKGKFARVPSLTLLARLHKRNEYFIGSHLPLRETLIQQTGLIESDRRAFLQKHYNETKRKLIYVWEPERRGTILF